MNPLRKALSILLFMTLIVDLLFFALFNTNPETFRDFLTGNLGPEALGLTIVGGFITAIVTSVILVVVFYKEIKIDWTIENQSDLPRVKTASDVEMDKP